MKVCRDSFTFLTGLATDVIKTRNKSNKPWVTGGLRKFKKFVVSCIKMANSSLLYKLEHNKIAKYIAQFIAIIYLKILQTIRKCGTPLM